MKLLNLLIYKHTKKIILVILALMFTLGFFSMKGDSLTTDEGPHIPAGYSYLKYQDMRLNPEHPPLIKDLAAIPLLFLKPNFPEDQKAWTDKQNAQWEIGDLFFKKYNENVDQIIFWSRLPVLLLTVLGGLLVFWVAYNIGKTKNKLTGKLTGLIALIFYAFNPTILAHGHLVTTDAAAAIFMFSALYSFARYINKPTKKNLILAVLLFTAAQLTKFSCFILVPMYFLSITIFELIRFVNNKKETPNALKTYSRYWLNKFGRTLLILFFGYALIYFFYSFHVQNMTHSGVHALIKNSIFKDVAHHPVREFLKGLNDIPGMKPLTVYTTGLFMVLGRVYSGHTVYFLGMISNQGWWYFFPIMFLFKEPLGFLCLFFIFITIWVKKILRFAGKRSKKSKATITKKLLNYVSKHYIESTLLLFAILYWLMSITSSLNLGIRHLLPVLPIMYIFIAKKIAIYLDKKERKLKKEKKRSTSTIKRLEPVITPWDSQIIYFIKRYGLLLTILIGISWYVTSSVLAFPNYLSYYNELIGGSKNGYKIAVDSNTDWGQGLKRLEKWADENDIKDLKIHYYGGGDPENYFGDNYIDWQNGAVQPEGWFALSVSRYQGAKKDKRKGGFDYDFLKDYDPVDRVGNTFLIYKIDKLDNPKYYFPLENKCQNEWNGWSCRLTADSNITTYTKETIRERYEIRKACEEQGGEYVCTDRCLPYYTQYCFIPFEDKGDKCNDSKDCKGDCYASKECVDNRCDGAMRCSECVQKCTAYPLMCGVKRYEGEEWYILLKKGLKTEEDVCEED